MTKDEIKKWIEGYKHEQKVLLRLIRKLNGLTASKFDQLYEGREYRKRMKISSRGISGDSFLLGLGSNGMNMWAENLDLLQHMVAIDLVDTKRKGGGEIVYILNT